MSEDYNKVLLRIIDDTKGEWPNDEAVAWALGIEVTEYDFNVFIKELCNER